MTGVKSFLPALLFLMASTVHSAGLGFLEDTVLASLDEKEVASFKQLIRKTLDQTPDTKLIHWRSPSSEKAGKILPKYSYQTAGLNCRRALFQLSDAKKRKENYRFDICQRNGGWEVVSSPLSLSKQSQQSLTFFMNQVLSGQELGQPASWRAVDKTHSAVIVPLSEEDGCRSAAISLSDTAGHTLDGQYRFCETAKGEWQYQP